MRNNMMIDITGASLVDLIHAAFDLSRVKCSCDASTGICGCCTQGTGKLDDNGFWENPCPHGNAFGQFVPVCDAHLKEVTISDEDCFKLIHYGIPFPVAIGDLKNRRVNLLVTTDGRGSLFIPRDWCEHSELQLKNLLLRLGIRYNFQENRHEIGCGCTICHIERVRLFGKEGMAHA